MTAARRTAALVLGLAALLPAASLAGCTAVAQDAQNTSIDTVDGVGALPGSFGTAPTIAGTVVEESAPDSATTVQAATTSTPTTVPADQTVGAKIAGNRLLIIGDSLTASISQRYGAEACGALVPLGWQVDVEAETGRFIDFGKKVLDRKLPVPGKVVQPEQVWDAAVIFLGNNYGYDKAKFKSAMNQLLLLLYPRPVVLVTTALFRPQQSEVNDSIHEFAEQYDHVTVLEWAAISADPGLTGGDGLHLSDFGRQRLAFEIANIMGPAPVQPGKCLESTFRDDSAGSPNGPAGNLDAPKTTVRPTQTTKPSTSSTTATTAPTSSSTNSSTATTVAPVTTPAPVTTAVPPTTAPPATTEPPKTVPTLPPVTIAPPGT